MTKPLASPVRDLPLSAPPRSLEQRMTALGRANEIRSARAGMKRDLEFGRVSFLKVIARPPECARTMKLSDLLLATPKIGRVKMQKALARHKISPSKTIDGLSDRQRAELVADRQWPACAIGAQG